MTVLPLTVGDFQLLEEYRMVEKDGNPVEYRLFTYENKENGWTVRAIFNPESEEYAVRSISACWNLPYRIYHRVLRRLS